MAIKSTGLTTKGIRGEFFMTLKQTPTVWPRLTTRMGSDSDFESHKFLGAVAMPREWTGPRKATGLITEGYNIVNKKYESTIEVHRDELEDEKVDQIMIRVRELAQRAAQHKDNLLASLIEANPNSYDQVAFFSSAHVSGSSGTQDNTTTSNITTPADPTTDEFSAAFRTMIQRMMTFKDEQGVPTWMGNTGLMIVVPPNMYFRALQIVNSTMVADALAGTNLAAQENILKGAAEVVAFPFLTSTDRFYLFKTDVQVRPFIFQDRVPLEFTAKDRPDDDNAFDSDVYRYGTRARFAIAAGRWAYAIRHIFT